MQVLIQTDLLQKIETGIYENFVEKYDLKRDDSGVNPADLNKA
jgi:hypothetical protein